MKYIIFLPPLIILIVLSFIIGGICYLWGFSDSQFRWGTSYINEDLFPGIIDKLIKKLERS